MLFYSKEDVQQIIDKLGFVVLITDHRGYVEQVNKPYELYFYEVAKTQLINNPIKIFTDYYDIYFVDEMVSMALNGKDIYKNNCYVRDKLFEISAHPIFLPGGKIIGTTVFFKNLIDKTNLQVKSQRLKRTQTFNKLNKYKFMSTRDLEIQLHQLDRLNIIGEIAASIGHEVRNPLTAIKGFLQLLQEKKECTTYHDYFKIMSDEIDRANSIISEFLNLANNKVSDLKINNLNSVINYLQPLLQAKALVGDKVIVLDLGQIPELLMDSKEIRQLIFNLVNNGLEAMMPGGKLTIKTFVEHDNVVLIIKDEGKGIDAEIIKKLGTPFVTTKENGTGLGLPVCFRIAERHNAAINVESGLGGTTFYIRFKTNNLHEIDYDRE